MLYDIHSHILPNIDDGAAGLEETECMLKTAMEDGIRVIVATPHYLCGMEKHQEDVKNTYEMVRSMWKELSELNEMYLGSELFYGENLLSDLELGKAGTMNGTRYILVEFPTYVEFSYLRRSMQELLYAGYMPILAHTERYQCMRNLERVLEVTELGSYIQINGSALLGNQGLPVKMFAKKLLKHNLIHFIGTDAHDNKERSPKMKECEAYIKKKAGEERMRQILVEHPEKMLRGEKLE